MKINLRKANAIQQEIKAALKEQRPDVKVSISEFQDVETVLGDAQKAYAASVQRSQGLVAALYAVRKMTASANMVSGINDTLNRIAEIDESMQLLKPGTTAQARQLDITVLTGKLEKIRSQPADNYGYTSSDVETGILTEANLEENKAALDALKREKRDLQDKLLELNVASSITLPDEAVACLKAEGIL